MYNERQTDIMEVREKDEREEREVSVTRCGGGVHMINCVKIKRL